MVFAKPCVEGFGSTVLMEGFGSTVLFSTADLLLSNVLAAFGVDSGEAVAFGVATALVAAQSLGVATTGSGLSPTLVVMRVFGRKLAA